MTQRTVRAVSTAWLLASVAPVPAAAAPLKVFILAGQSNMQGQAQVRTFEHIGMDPATAPMPAEMINPDGSPKVCQRVWISSVGCAEEEQTGRLTAGSAAAANGPKIGPEFTFGLHLQKFTAAPILLLKTSWGGKSLHTDFRPPSAGPYVFTKQQLAAFRKQGKDIAAIQTAKAAATGVSYRLMIEHVRRVLADVSRVAPNHDSAGGYELAGFVWLQGWNDLVGSVQLQAALDQGWLRVVKLDNPTLATAFCEQVDRGEAEAIALALQLNAAPMLIDEREARALATSLGLKVTGVLGVLLRAHAEGDRAAVAPILDALESEADFRIAVLLRQAVPAESGEL